MRKAFRYKKVMNNGLSEWGEIRLGTERGSFYHRVLEKTKVGKESSTSCHTLLLICYNCMI